MTKLRERMLQDLQLRGYAERTQQMYVRAVRKLAEHYGKSPAKSPKKNCATTFSMSRTSRNGLVLPAPLRCAASSSSSNTPSNATGRH